MTRISDELREFADAEVLSAIQISDLKHMAKRIDAEMVELPRDKDWKPIHCGDTVFLDDGREAEVKAIQFYDDGSATITCKMVDDFSFTRHTSSSLTHTRPDSLERIAEELDEQAGSLTKDGYTWQEDAIHDFAVRISKLAKEEDRQCQ